MKKTKKLAIIFGVALVLLTPVLGLIPPSMGRASAAVEGSYTDVGELRGAVLDHQYYYWLMACFRLADMDKVTDDEVKNWEWFKGSSYDAVRGGMYKVQRGDCDNGDWMKEGMSRFGYTDPVVAFCKLSFTYNRETGGNGKTVSGGNNSDACESGVNAGKDSDGSGSKENQQKAIDSLLKSSSKYSKAKGSLTSAEEFIRTYDTLINGCNVLLINEYDEDSDPAAGDPNLVKVPVVTDGTSKISYALGKIELASVVLPKSAPLVAQTDGGSKMIECEKAAEQARDLAPAYQKYLKENNVDTPDPNGTGNAGEGVSIDTQCGDFSLTFVIGLEWITCPIISIASYTSGKLENFIVGMLCVDEGSIFGATSTCNGDPTADDNESSAAFKNSWNVFRIIALGLLAIAGLVMIISQGLGFEIFDAYTVKKTLPRLLVAGIGITLSWQLLEFAVGLSNGIGIGIRSLIYAPFVEANIDKIVLNGGASAVAALFTGGAWVTLGTLGLLSFILTAFLAILIAFFLLIVRNIVVIMLILVAPVAIAMYVLPNTEKYYKTWWDWLLKALLVFPIITAFIAIGHVFAAITYREDGGLFSNIVAFTAYFAPYFMIPLAFRFAGGLMATLGGFANDRSRGGFDRLKNFRKARSARNIEAARNFSRFSERSRLGRGLNTALGTGMNPTTMLGARHGVDGLRSSVNARRTSNQAIHGANMMKDNKIFQANQNDDNFLLALANRDLAVNKINQARTNRDAAIAAGNFADQNKYQAELDAREKGLNSVNQMNWFERENRSTRTAALDGLARTGYQFSAGEAGYKELDSTVRSIVGNDEQARAQLMDSAQFNLKSAGRFDLGGINHGSGYSFETGINKSSGYTAGQGKGDVFIAGAQNYMGNSVVGSDGKTLESAALSQYLYQGIQTGSVSGEKLAEWHGKLLDAEQSATGGNKAEIEKQRAAIESILPALTRDESGYSSNTQIGPNGRPVRTSGVDRPRTENVTRLVEGVRNNQARGRMDPNDPRLHQDG